LACRLFWLLFDICFFYEKGGERGKKERVNRTDNRSAQIQLIGLDGLIPFVGLFVLFIGLGFYGKYWRKGDLNDVHEWALAGRKLGTALVFFLVGADLYTAYTFVAIPSGVFAKGSLYFFAIPYVSLTFAIALVTMPRLWSLAKEKGYITASDFVKDRFGSKTLSVLIAITGIISLLPYIALQIVGMQ